MNNDIPESVSQRGYGAYDAENRRIREISDELQRLCRLHEAQSGAGQADGSRFEVEQRIAEQYAKTTGLWISHAGKWYYAYSIHEDVITIEDACHEQNMYE